MDHKIPITDIDKIVYSNIVINKNKIKYNINELYKDVDLHILIKNVNESTDRIFYKFLKCI